VPLNERKGRKSGINASAWVKADPGTQKSPPAMLAGGLKEKFSWKLN